MRTTNKKAQIRPGWTAKHFTREEAAEAIFRFVYGVTPTVEELQRLTINVNDGVASAWELVLTITDPPEVSP